MNVSRLKTKKALYNTVLMHKTILKTVVQNNSPKNVCFKQENDPYIKFKCMLIDQKIRMYHPIQFCCRNRFKNKLYEIIDKKTCQTEYEIDLEDKLYEIDLENDPYVKLNMKHCSKRQKCEKNMIYMLID
jgi:hypothetical protein